jgi:hypothetical protein
LNFELLVASDNTDIDTMACLAEKNLSLAVGLEAEIHLEVFQHPCVCTGVKKNIACVRVNSYVHPFASLQLPQQLYFTDRVDAITMKCQFREA